jgi:hypothetical protein
MKIQKPSMSPVIKADVKFCAYKEPRFWVEVRFRGKEEINTLIDTLMRLRDTKGAQYDHVHLQDSRLRIGSSRIEGEVNFFRPGIKRGWERKFITEARRILENWKGSGMP